MEFEPVIGLEIHVQMDTKTKMFCSCKVQLEESPNINVCPVCLALPGSLPVINEKAIEYGTRAALALNCNVNLISVFARKNYFYPDLPKGYQISQYEKPLSENGYVKINVDGKEKTVRIKRLHLEEDAGKNIHEGQNTYVDLNRAGTPLMEIVTEPDINSSLEAKIFLEKLRNIMRYIGVSKADMEKGQLRCDVNISLRPKGTQTLGTRVEVKNVNSFKFVQKAIEYEIERQTEILLNGKEVVQETRTFDPASGKTYSLRTKEEAEDYRYFKDPDLLDLVLEESFIENIKKTMPELPDERKKRFEELGLSSYEASILTDIKELGDYFEKATKNSSFHKEIATILINDVLGFLNDKNISIEELDLEPAFLSELVALQKDGTISSKIAKNIIKEMLETKKSPSAIVKEKGLTQISDENELKGIILKVLESFPAERERLKNGEQKVLGFLVGEVMKQTKGKANPKLVNKLIMELL